MSLREKIRLNLPLYLVLSIVFSISVWSLWLPKWLGTPKNAEAAPVTSFSTAINAVTRIPSAAQVKLAYYDGTYAMVFASTSSALGGSTTTCAYLINGPQACQLYFTSSTDGGTTWGRPVLVSSELFFNSNREAISFFTYDTRRSMWMVGYKRNQSGTDNNLVQSYSTNGISWSTATVISDNGHSSSAYLGRDFEMALATSSNLRAVLAQKGDYLVIGTTSNSGLSTSWPTSTIMSTVNYRNDEAGDWEKIRPLGLSIDAFNNIHAVIGMATTSAAGGYEIIYASSTDLGVSWTTSSISGRMAPVSSDLIGFELGINEVAVDPYTGRLTLFYYQTTGIDSGLMSSSIISGTSTLRVGILGANGVWTTSTLDQTVPFHYSLISEDTNFSLVSLSPTGLTVPYTGMYAGAIFATSSNPYLVANTSTLVMERISTDTIFNMSEIATVYNPTLKELAVAYVGLSDYKLKFTTTSMRIAAVNDPATTTAFNPTLASSGGLVTVTTTAYDVNREEFSLYVDYSVDSGVTWSSSTLRTASGGVGELTTSSGRILGINTTDDAQVITFTWDSQADIPATSTANVRIRILADDGISSSGYLSSSSFTVDNLAPGVPTLPILTPSTSTMAFSWTASTGTPSLYLVSSTAMSVSSTVATVVTSTGLSPNTLYSFQVKAQDLYSNTSSFSTVTSTYTDPTVPVSVSASAAGSTSITVTWGANSNGSGTVYEVYNVTTAAVVDTTTDTSYTVTGLTASTAYQFKVRAQYLSNSSSYTDYSDTSTAVSTDASSSSGSSGGGGGSAAPAAPPVVPTAAPVTNPSAATIDLALNEQKKQKVGASEHTFTLLTQSSQKVSMKIQSEPIIVEFAVGIPKEVDTDKDGIADLKITYTGLVQGKAKIAIANLTDENELKNAMTIQAGAYETKTRKVTLSFGLENITQAALSNSADFSGASFVTFSKQKNWELSSGDGVKTVYARLRNAQGGMVTVSDTITLKESTVATPVQPPVVEKPVEIAPTAPQFKRLLKRGVTGSEVVQVQNELKKLNFFPKTIISNGVFGPTTEASVKAFEKAGGLKVDGVVDAMTWNALFGASTLVQEKPVSSTPAPTITTKKNLSRGASGENVLWVQQKLMSLGFFPKNVVANGYFGPTTFNSVKAYQKANGISQTGTVGPLTWNALSK